MEKWIQKTEESLLVYLQNQITQTEGHIIRCNNTINRLQKDYEETQSNKIAYARLINEASLELENYEFRLEYLVNGLERFKNTL
jgi:hypothetical protein